MHLYTGGPVSAPATGGVFATSVFSSFPLFGVNARPAVHSVKRMFLEPALTSKHLVFPQPAEALCALSHGKCPVGGATSASVWWLQKLWKPSGPPRRGGAHLGHVFI